MGGWGGGQPLLVFFTYNSRTTSLLEKNTNKGEFLGRDLGVVKL